MDAREQAQAGKALVEWFNSQEIGKADAKAIMAKVVALILCAEHKDRRSLERAADQHTVDIFNSVNDRILSNKWGGPR